MQTRAFGKTGVQVSRLGFGGMRLPIEKGEDGKVSGLEASAEVIRCAIDAGINYIDSAPFYCHHESETAVGLAIQGVPRDRIHLSTKYPLRTACGDCLKLRLELSLRKMQTDYIDFYHLWGVSWEKFNRFATHNEGPLDAAMKARQEGLIRHLSFSSHDEPKNIHRLIDTGHFESMLVQYNLLDQRNAECLAHAHEAGLGTAVMGPVGGGRLGTSSEVIRQATGCPDTAEAALRFVWADPNVDLALSGMQNIRMVRENVATAERNEPLSPRELNRIDALVQENRKLLDLPCTGCGYCTPCPQGVAIPQIFQLYQWHEVFDLKGSARKGYAKLGRGQQKKHQPASQCAACGECEPKCPQKIAIVERLKDAHATLTAD